MASKWTGESVLFFYTTDYQRFSEVVPVDVINEYERKRRALQQRYPALYCNVPEEKYQFRYNKEWKVTHSKLMAKILNAHKVPVAIMEEGSKERAAALEARA